MRTQGPSAASGVLQWLALLVADPASCLVDSVERRKADSRTEPMAAASSRLSPYPTQG